MAHSGARADSLEPCGWSEAGRPSRLVTPTEELSLHPSLHPFTGPTPGTGHPSAQLRGPLADHAAQLQADELSQAGLGPEVGLATRKPRGHEGRVASQQPITALWLFSAEQKPGRPGSSRCCSIEISRWFSINHSLWCLGGQKKESNKASFLSRRTVPVAPVPLASATPTRCWGLRLPLTNETGCLGFRM